MWRQDLLFVIINSVSKRTTKLCTIAVVTRYKYLAFFFRKEVDVKK